MTEYVFQKEPVWTPSENSGKKMKAFMKYVEGKYDLNFSKFHFFTYKVTFFYHCLRNKFHVIIVLLLKCSFNFGN